MNQLARRIYAMRRANASGESSTERLQPLLDDLDEALKTKDAARIAEAGTPLVSWAEDNPGTAGSLAGAAGTAAGVAPDLAEQTLNDLTQALGGLVVTLRGLQTPEHDPDSDIVANRARRALARRR